MNTPSFLTTAMRLAEVGSEQSSDSVFDNIDRYGNEADKLSEWSSQNDFEKELSKVMTNKDKRYSEFLGKRRSGFYSLNPDTGLLGEWNRLVQKRQDEVPFAKRYMEFLGKRQQELPTLLKRYVEFLG